jgi:hypothetical protein
MKINIKQAEKLAKHYQINLDVINFDEWHYGLNVELEHGKKFGIITNITNNNFSITAKIVIAHLTEFPDYYKRLLKLETAADKYWSNKKKPNIFLI